MITQDLQIIEAYLSALQCKDISTYHHCLRVGYYSHLLAKALNLTDSETQQTYYAGVLHDIGKISTPNAILHKAEKLTVEEYEIMKKHPEHGAQILMPYKDLLFIKKALPGILHHHEYINGKGYPHGLKGNQIPCIAKILAVTDTYDAITSTRKYSGNKTSEFAYSEIYLHKSIQFDPDIAGVFLKQHPSWTIDENASLKLKQLSQI